MRHKLRPYMVSGEEPNEGAILVFAHTAREAKAMGFCSNDISIMDLDYIDIRVKWLKNNDWAYTQADTEKNSKGIPHIVEYPEMCDRCHLWGGKLEAGICEYCKELE